MEMELSYSNSLHLMKFLIAYNEFFLIFIFVLFSRTDSSNMFHDFINNLYKNEDLIYSLSEKKKITRWNLKKKIIFIIRLYNISLIMFYYSEILIFLNCYLQISKKFSFLEIVWLFRSLLLNIVFLFDILKILVIKLKNFFL